MSQEMLLVSERVHHKRTFSRSSHNVSYLEVPCVEYSLLVNTRDNNGRQRSSSMTSSPVKSAFAQKNRRRRSLSPRLTAKSNALLSELVPRRSSVTSIATQIQGKAAIEKRINILMIGGENVGKACLAEYLDGSSISSSSSSDDWECSSGSSPSPHGVNIRVHNDINGLSHVYKYDLVLLLYSVTDSATFRYIKNIVHVATGLNQKPVILVGNKIDLVRARVVSTADGHRLATDNSIKFIEISALLNLNLKELLNGIKAQTGVQSAKKKVKLFEKIAGLLSHGRMSRSCLDLHTL